MCSATRAPLSRTERRAVCRLCSRRMKHPSTSNAPCCRNEYVIFASIILLTTMDTVSSNTSTTSLLMSNASGVGRAGGVQRSFGELMGVYERLKNATLRDGDNPVFLFAEKRMQAKQPFMQMVVSRDQRMTGVVFGVGYIDEGCIDPAVEEEHKLALSVDALRSHTDTNLEGREGKSWARVRPMGRQGWTNSATCQNEPPCKGWDMPH